MDGLRPFLNNKLKPHLGLRTVGRQELVVLNHLFLFVHRLHEGIVVLVGGDPVYL